MRKIIAFLVTLLVLALVWRSYERDKAVPAVGEPSDVIASAMFVCAEGKSIGAEFRKRSVTLELSDGRSLELPQTISASGARYANADESFVFWNKGNTAFVEERGELSFADCLTPLAE